MEKAISASYRLARQIVVLVVGLTVLITGVAMLVLPGPGLVTVFLGLTILAIEFAWARYWLNKLKSTAGHAQRGAAQWFSGRTPGPHQRPPRPSTTSPEENLANPPRHSE